MTFADKKVTELTDAQLEQAAGGKTVWYIVEKGDTLIRIAQHYGTNYKKLAECNGIANPNLIRVGQRIKICW